VPAQMGAPSTILETPVLERFYRFDRLKFDQLIWESPRSAASDASKPDAADPQLSCVTISTSTARFRLQRLA